MKYLGARIFHARTYHRALSGLEIMSLYKAEKRRYLSTHWWQGIQFLVREITRKIQLKPRKEQEG